MSSAGRWGKVPLAIVGAVLIGIGSVLPWAKVESQFGDLSVAGTEGDGVITLIAAVVLAIGGFMRIKSPGSTFAKVLIVLSALVAGVTAAYDMSSISDIGGNEFATASVGIGLYVVLAGAVVGMLGAFGKPAADVAVPPQPVADPPHA